jgi:hypothetical protein
MVYMRESLLRFSIVVGGAMDHILAARYCITQKLIWIFTLLPQSHQLQFVLSCIYFSLALAESRVAAVVAVVGGVPLARSNGIQECLQYRFGSRLEFTRTHFIL